MRPRLAVRCDGGAEIGAGHVARCLPIAGAFGARGWEVAFVGRYDGLAQWLLDERGARRQAPARQVTGVDRSRFQAALVDLYGLPEGELCRLAAALPVATLAEAARCPDAGVWIDYHLDRSDVADGPRLLAGARYVPVDPAFAGSGSVRDDVRRVLITVGGSAAARTHLQTLQALVAQTFPGAEVLVAPGPGGPTRLLDLVGEIDLAVTAAGLTAYELACAGVAQVTLAIVPNQARVAAGLRARTPIPVVDLCAGDGIEAVGAGLAQLRDPAVRRAQSERARTLIDGRGAARIADALERVWAPEARAA